MENVNRLPEPLGSNCTYIYRDLDWVGSGGFGMVYRATVTDNGNYTGDKTVAVKKIPVEIQDTKPSLSKSGNGPGILEKWGKLLRLRHSNVVSFHKITCVHLDVGKAVIEIMMDYFAGGDLHRTLADYKKNRETFPQETMLNYAMQLTEGLAYLHQHRIVHGDIKPANILVMRHSSPTESEITLKIGDLDNFIQLQESLTCSMDVNRLIGSVRYMSPEMLRRFWAMSADVVGRKTDVWSLGCVLHELFDLGFGIDDRWLCKSTEMFRVADGMHMANGMANKVIDGYVPFISNTIPGNLSAILHSCLKSDAKIRIGSSSLIGELQNSMVTDYVADTAKCEMEETLDPAPSKNSKEDSTVHHKIGESSSDYPGDASGRVSVSHIAVQENPDTVIDGLPRIKIVLVGGVAGKTCLIHSFLQNKFLTTHVPTMFEHHQCTVSVGKEFYPLGLFDTTYHDDYGDRLRPLSYQHTDVFLVCHAVTDVNMPRKWVDEIKYHCPRTPFILVGTQIDLREDPDTLTYLTKDGRKLLSSEAGREMAISIGARCYVECSALTQEGVKNVFAEAIIIALSGQDMDLHREKRRKKMCPLM